MLGESLDVTVTNGRGDTAVPIFSADISGWRDQAQKSFVRHLSDPDSPTVRPVDEDLGRILWGLARGDEGKESQITQILNPIYRHLDSFAPEIATQTTELRCQFFRRAKTILAGTIGVEGLLSSLRISLANSILDYWESRWQEKSLHGDRDVSTGVAEDESVGTR